MQAALMLRSKSRVARRRKLRKLGGRLELPSNVATKEIAPFPRYPPESWVIKIFYFNCLVKCFAPMELHILSTATTIISSIHTNNLFSKTLFKTPLFQVNIKLISQPTCLPFHLLIYFVPHSKFIYTLNSYSNFAILLPPKSPSVSFSL